MSTEQYKEMVRRIPLEAVNKGNLAVVDEVIAENFVNHSPLPGLGTDREGLRQLFTGLRGAFPDFQYTLDDQIAEGSYVAHRATATGTHKGEFMGIPATGKRLRWQELHVVRLDGGKCVEHWGNVDDFSIMQQLGLVLPLGQPAVGQPSIPGLSMPNIGRAFSPGARATSPLENKGIVRRWIDEGFNRGELAALDRYFTADYVNHDPANPFGRLGVEGAKQFTSTIRTAFPDCYINVEDQIAEGDKVVTRWVARGTHKGDFMGVAPTGRLGQVAGIEIDRFADGKMAESWVVWDLLGLLRQLGIVPSR